MLALLEHRLESPVPKRNLNRICICQRTSIQRNFGWGFHFDFFNQVIKTKTTREKFALVNMGITGKMIIWTNKDWDELNDVEKEEFERRRDILWNEYSQLNFSHHSLDMMALRGIRKWEVERTLQNGRCFNKIKGYYFYDDMIVTYRDRLVITAWYKDMLFARKGRPLPSYIAFKKYDPTAPMREKTDPPKYNPLRRRGLNNVRNTNIQKSRR